MAEFSNGFIRFAKYIALQFKKLLSPKIVQQFSPLSPDAICSSLLDTGKESAPDDDVVQFRSQRASEIILHHPVQKFPGGLLNVAASVGYTEPRPLQSQVWPIAMSGIDVHVIAEKGNGRILAYLLPAVLHAKALPNLRPGQGPVILILVPTVTRVFEVKEEVRKFGHPMGVTACAITGLSFAEARESDELRVKGKKIVIAVPHALCRMVNSNHTYLRSVTYLVLDEMDQMLGLQYECEVRQLLQEIRRECQTLYFFSRHSEEVGKLAADILRDPVHVQIGHSAFEEHPLDPRWLNVLFSADPDPIEYRFPAGLSFRGADGDWHAQ